MGPMCIKQVTIAESSATTSTSIGMRIENSGCGAKNVARCPHCEVSNATKSDPPVSHQDGIYELVTSGMKSTRILLWSGHDPKAQHGWYYYIIANSRPLTKCSDDPNDATTPKAQIISWP